MIIPSSTYRIQFRNGMTFDGAAALVPYLKRLGISHLYASPIFTATSGSTHGYDVTDANELDPTLGGREGFDRLSRALQENELGLILDIVPNHMAASLENPWWYDVVEHGEESRFAHYFDIDWSRRLTLPFLGDTFDTVLSNGELSIQRDPKTGKPSLTYYETDYPLKPSSYEGREEEVLSLRKPEEIADLHDRQPWRLMSWRDAPRELSYRRFFEITGLVGLRVEDPEVFDAAHRTVLELVRDGRVDGLRIDHVDGLADPKDYLDRLRKEVGPETYIVVEKILGEGEQIPADWPISGTTGYEFIGALSDALVDGSKSDALTDAYEAVTGQPGRPLEELRQAKLLMANNNFEGEVAALRKLAVRLRDAGEASDSISDHDLHNALRELLVAFPVYRTYGTADGMPNEGRERLAEVVRSVEQGPHAPGREALQFIQRILLGEVATEQADVASLFRMRFQQLTGPLMAKSLEDTLFFRHHRFIALNEVGSEAEPHPASLEHFHQEMQTRLQRQPHALSGTSTHDTKRGEDARARLYTLSEAPDVWAEAVTRWRAMNRANVALLADGPAPEPAVEWMLYQALLGAWPADLAAEDAAGLKALEERFLAFVEKALREAKQRTSWNDTNEEYEGAVKAYAAALLAPDNREFLSDFTNTITPFVRTGLVNGITQTLIKLTAPGVPDIYQGSERLDLSLVDPDNRRPPDFALLGKGLADGPQLPSEEADWHSGRLKQNVISKVLNLRQKEPALFSAGNYLPLDIKGKRAPNIISCARQSGDNAMILIAPRLVFGAFRHGHYTSIHWAETDIDLPDTLAGRSYKDIFTGREYQPKGSLSVNWCFAGHPFALLVSQ
ncbi:(1-_4)-alpha-D-glucan 1-alpha-D-glucosylmutase [Pseudorhizobium tarimense]|uniref:(1->4)-alpha-D-glucan 1-alpha-D-glucosylmutase n=1 Tax=Pseudorhizobium tarimense TaxID=1079109 RepID=A0ABV2H7J7_9HYPH|nr:malto-oligosyltrehalose synthase [Pseudorhizobium tarimense]MCJ8519634.1 malto-oligosyltrehalose synthase [Pseudorhizobium tarimense]